MRRLTVILANQVAAIRTSPALPHFIAAPHSRGPSLLTSVDWWYGLNIRFYDDSRIPIALRSKASLFDLHAPASTKSRSGSRLNESRGQGGFL